MEFEFHPNKDAINVAKHGLSLDDARNFDLRSASVIEDARRAYGEVRFRAFGRIEGKGFCLAFTMRGKRLRLISFRRAHDREMRHHGR